MAHKFEPLRYNPANGERVADMLHAFWECLQQHHRTVGVWGDSLTFLGGLLLSAEALFKKKDRLTLASIATVVKLFPGAEDGKGNKLTTTTEEDKQLKRWEKVAKWGVGLLTLGFLLLLLLRISE